MPEMPSAKETTSPFERLLADLVRSGVDYAVVGGVAVSLNGFIRATDDLDILVHEAAGNIRRLLDCLAAWGEGWARELTVEDFAPQEGSIRVIEDFELDVFVRMRGQSLDEFRSRLRHLETSGVRIPYLAAEDLILLKQDSWREKDKLDVAVLRKLLAK
jgi:hypothetical protein